MGFFKKVTHAIAKPFKAVGHAASSFYHSSIGRALTYAALAVAAVYTGGAALGAAGLTTAGAAAGGGMAGAAAGGAAAAGGMAGIGAGIAGGMSGAQQQMSIDAANKQERQQVAAEARAQAESERAYRDSEILRKQALLASQKSMTARKATAGQIANRLRNTSQALGDEEDTLGG